MKEVKPIFLSKDDTAAALSVSLSTLYQLEREGKLTPGKITANRVGYLLREIEAFAESCPASDIPPPPNTGAKKPREKAEQGSQD